MNNPKLQSTLENEISEVDNTKSIFTHREYGTAKVSINIDKDVFELARCLCFIVPTISPQDLLENVLRAGIVEICSDYSKELNSTFKRNPYNKLNKHLQKKSE